ncbi:thioesterase family protein [Ponticaulis sp.]|uniref:thioesterase family protein n=1 Tax=Ponticaulis sp. TaxID=2020902 RepID=UPI000B66391D|nr:thioesterase family protein [Ponticaulis sp.]MAI90791.1 acyl-[acyl-carrier-protein] thioesterase [Ponticaulis sp.]OUX99015.1 MAG: acyl-[acyl-carrier-protein] thioesterase [Hyphomonadaceae bacterium TMED5]|tara:strand:- start:73900 stop:74838 length:939 start_codon:yes stop_codon:yes gene_type:complete
MIELYRGITNTWECDEMGHMNVRFYVNKQTEGLAIMAHALGMPNAFQPGHSSTLIPVDQHIRFMKEVHPGRPIVMVGGILDVSENEIVVYQELKHVVSGETAAAFRTRVRHVESKTLKGFAWKDATLNAITRLKMDAPELTAPRSLDPDAPFLPDEKALSLVPDELGVPVIGRGAVPIQHCDSHGRMLPEFFIGRVSDSVPNLMGQWREEVANAAEAKGEKIHSGAAVLEYRLKYRRWPKAGDLIEVRTGLGKVLPKVHSLVHWLMDPSTGKAWCTSEAVAVTFDLDTRKVIPANPEHMALLEQRAVRGLTV